MLMSSYDKQTELLPIANFKISSHMASEIACDGDGNTGGGNGGSSNRGEGTLLLGTRVRIIDLINKKQHNNKEGVIVAAMDETTGRVEVRFDDLTTWNVKMTNIAFLPHNLGSINNLPASREKDFPGMETAHTLTSTHGSNPSDKTETLAREIPQVT